MRALVIASMLLVSPAHAAVFDWSNSCATWHFNPNNVRDPTAVFNNTGITNYGECPGYDNTQYAFKPCNFAPSVAASPNQTWTDIPLGQFGLPVTAKEVILTGNSAISGPNQWTGAIEVWFRKPGSTWALSPIIDGGYKSSFTVHAPVGLINGIPNIEISWYGLGLNIGPAGPSTDTASLNFILSGWCE